MPPSFESQAYWHTRFSNETCFEWLASSSSFMEILSPFLAGLPSSARLLHLGSGTSDLHNQLRAQGFQDVTNIDYEPLAVQRGQDLEKSSFGDVRMKYVVADVTDLDLGRGGKYDMVFDKSTADAISCGGEDAMLRMAESVRKYLAPGGVWISLSYSSSRFDVEGLPFEAEVLARIPVPKNKESEPDVYHWCYLLRP